MVNGQDFTTKDIQLLRYIDICSGTSSTELYTMAQHQDYWYHLTDDQLMTEYIARHKDQQPLQELEDLKNTIEYGCSDPRLHPRHQEHSEEATKEAERRIDDDFQNLSGVFEC